MRRIIITAALTIAAGAAQASSIEKLAPTLGSKSSIIVFGCPSCVEAAKKAEEEKLAPPLAPGSQSVEVRMVDGKPMVYRTDNWLGGSAVTWVSKGTPLELQAYGLEPETDTKIAATPVDGIHPEDPAFSIVEAPSNLETEVAQTPKASGPASEGAETASKMIDRSATTSAIIADAASGPKPFDASKMELRLN